MTALRPVVVLRPEPGNAATAMRVESAGAHVVQLPLFSTRPVAWEAPDIGRFDTLLVTSGNAIRLGGAGLGALRGLPVAAVGAETAQIATDAGFKVAVTGTGDAQDVAARAAGRLLHLAGQDHRVAAGATTIVVYAAEALDVDLSGLTDCVAMLHSARAAVRFAELIEPGRRATIRIAALSPAVAAAAGDGWRNVVASDVPRDAALVALAVRLADADSD